MTKATTPWVIKPLVPEEIYTDRQEYLDFFYNEARKAATRRSMSTVLLGRRRMGKTEIFKRVVNRLFFEQDPLDPMSVVPVYYRFPERGEDEWQFAKKYLENFICYYVGFYTRQPQLITGSLQDDELLATVEQARSLYPFRQTLDWMIRWYDSVRRKNATVPIQVALEAIRRVSDVDDTTIVVFLDEFQNTRLPQYSFDIVGYLQEAVESPTCPHFVTGSAMSILSREIIGRGSLFGRFESKPIEPLSQFWGAQQALKSADYYQAQVSELMAPMLTDRCGGNPFYINAVIRQASALQIPLINEEAINRVLAVDISSGFIWAELHEQVNSWIERVNEYGITKWILYLSATEPAERINLARIQQELIRQGKDVSLDKIREVLVKLSRGDLLEYLELGGWFRKIDDPILLEFLKIWGAVEVEGRNAQQVQDELVKEYRALRQRVSEYRGYLAEVFMSQVLFNSQDRSKLPIPGHFFNSANDIQMDWPLSYIRHRMRLGAGRGQEIDLLAAIGVEKWVCQSKWVVGKKVGIDVLHQLMTQAEAVRREFDPPITRMWLFAHDGLTKEAERLARRQGIFWSNREQLDGVLSYLGLRKLPNL